MTNIDTDVDAAPTLTMLATSCASGTCPTIFQSDRGTYVIQGYAVDAGRAGVTLAPDELLVEIPADLLAGILAGDDGTSGI
jgi:hypothetical protein